MSTFPASPADDRVIGSTNITGVTGDADGSLVERLQLIQDRLDRGIPVLSGNGYMVTPSAANGVDITGAASAWGNATYVQVTTGFGEARYLRGLTFLPEGASRDYEIDIAVGGAGSETVIATIPATAGATINAFLVWLPEAIAIASSTRVAVRCRCDQTTSDGILNVKIITARQADLG